MDTRVSFHVEKQLKQALSALEIASDCINDTGNIEDEELDQIAMALASLLIKVNHYIGKL